MTMRAMVCAVVACAMATVAHAQVDFNGLDVTHYPAPAPVQKGGVNPAQGMPVTQAPQVLPVAPPEAGTFAAPELTTEQPYDTPAATWNTYRGYRGHGGYGYRWYPGYARHDDWVRSHYFTWNTPSYGGWYGYGYGNWSGYHGTDPRWYGTHPSWRPYGWRDRAYPYAWSPSSVICSW